MEYIVDSCRQVPIMSSYGGFSFHSGFLSGWQDPNRLQAPYVSFLTVDPLVSMNINFDVTIRTPSVVPHRHHHQRHHHHRHGGKHIAVPESRNNCREAKKFEDSVMNLMNPYMMDSLAKESKLNPDAPEFHPRNGYSSFKSSVSSSPSVSQVMSERMGFSGVGVLPRCRSDSSPRQEIRTAPEEQKELRGAFVPTESAPNCKSDCDKPVRQNPAPCAVGESWKNCANPHLAHILGVDSDEEDSDHDSADGDDDDEDWDCVDGYDPVSGFTACQSDPEPVVEKQSDDICSGKKRVSFAEGPALHKVHRIVAWDYAYRKSREGPWYQMSVDRLRFRDRIKRVERTLSQVLEPDHREKIYQARFVDL